MIGVGHRKRVRPPLQDDSRVSLMNSRPIPPVLQRAPLSIKIAPVTREATSPSPRNRYGKMLVTKPPVHFPVSRDTARERERERERERDDGMRA